MRRYMKPWNPLASKAAFGHLLRVIKSNLAPAFRCGQSFSVLAVLILAAYLGAMLWNFKRLIYRPGLLDPALSSALYASGFLALVVDPRYLWINQVLLILMASSFFHKAPEFVYRAF